MIKILFSCLRTVKRLVLYQVRILARTSRLLPFMHTTFYTILWVSLKPWQCHERSDNDWGVSLLSKPTNCPFKSILKHCNLSSCFWMDPGLWPLKYKEHLASPFYITFSLSTNHDPVQSSFYRTNHGGPLKNWRSIITCNVRFTISKNIDKTQRYF